MELADVLKIVIPIIVSLCGTVAACIVWIVRREDTTNQKEDQATKEYWQTVHSSLERMINELATRLKEFDKDHGAWRTRSDARVQQLEKELYEFKALVGGEYLKREVWGQHAQALEHKLDLLRSDFNKEFKELIQKVAERSKQS